MVYDEYVIFLWKLLSIFSLLVIILCGHLWALLDKSRNRLIATSKLANSFGVAILCAGVLGFFLSPSIESILIGMFGIMFLLLDFLSNPLYISRDSKLD